MTSKKVIYIVEKKDEIINGRKRVTFKVKRRGGNILNITETGVYDVTTAIANDLKIIFDRTPHY